MLGLANANPGFEYRFVWVKSLLDFAGLRVKPFSDLGRFEICAQYAYLSVLDIGNRKGLDSFVSVYANDGLGRILSRAFLHCR